ncbi:hypothetical protein Tco_1264294 [Tanacetum coccineum]
MDVEQSWGSSRGRGWRVEVTAAAAAMAAGGGMAASEGAWCNGFSRSGEEEHLWMVANFTIVICNPNSANALVSCSTLSDQGYVEDFYDQ